MTAFSAALLNTIFMLLLIFIMFKSKNQWVVRLFVIAIIGDWSLTTSGKRWALSENLKF